MVFSSNRSHHNRFFFFVTNIVKYLWLACVFAIFAQDIFTSHLHHSIAPMPSNWSPFYEMLTICISPVVCQGFLYTSFTLSTGRLLCSFLKLIFSIFIISVFSLHFNDFSDQKPHYYPRLQKCTCNLHSSTIS